MIQREFGLQLALTDVIKVAILPHQRRHAWHGIRMDRHTKTRKGVLSVDVHGTASANTFTAASSESERRVDLVLDSDQGIQNHGSSLVKINCIVLHSRFLLGGVGVPSIN